MLLQSPTLDGFVEKQPDLEGWRGLWTSEKIYKLSYRSGFRPDLAENDELFFSDPLYFLNYTSGTKKLSSCTLWTVLLRAARLWSMERLLDVCRSLQTLVINQVSCRYEVPKRL
jgi:hypothetical protein